MHDSNSKNSSDARTNRILVVDDELDLRELIQDLCESLANEVLIAENGKVAMDILRTTPVDVIVSDVTMPEMNGIVMLKTLRAEGFTMPLIFLSGYGERQNVLQALRYGAADFLDKPIQYEELEEAILRAIRMSKGLKP